MPGENNWKAGYFRTQKELKQAKQKIEKLTQEVLELRREKQIRRDGLTSVSGARAKY